MVDYLRTADSDEHNYTVATAVQRRYGCVTHARCCLLMLMGGSIVTSSSLHVLLSTCGVCPGLCAREREGNENSQNFTGTYVQNRPHTEKPRKSSYPLPPEKKLLRARHASYSARIELKPRPQVPDGLARR